MDPEQGDFQNLKDYPGLAVDESAETSSEGENHSQAKMWPITDGRIVKTTDVRVSRDPESRDMPGDSTTEPERVYDGMEFTPPKALNVSL